MTGEAVRAYLLCILGLVLVVLVVLIVSADPADAPRMTPQTVAPAVEYQP